MTEIEIVNKYLNVIFVENNKGAGLSDILAPDFIFDDPFGTARNAKEFIDHVQQWIQTKKSFTMHKQLVNETSVCSLYSIHVQTPGANTETFELSDYMEIKNSRIVKERVFFFDPLKFAKAMGFLDDYIKVYKQ